MKNYSRGLIPLKSGENNIFKFSFYTQADFVSHLARDSVVFVIRCAKIPNLNLITIEFIDDTFDKKLQCSVPFYIFLS